MGLATLGLGWAELGLVEPFSSLRLKGQNDNSHSLVSDTGWALVSVR